MISPIHFLPISVFRYSVMIALATLPMTLACAGSKKGPSSSRDSDTVVPQETQRRAEQNYGEQEAFMNDLSMSTSEQAGAAHDRAVDSARDPKREPRSK